MYINVDYLATFPTCLKAVTMYYDGRLISNAPSEEGSQGDSFIHFFLDISLCALLISCPSYFASDE